MKTNKWFVALAMGLAVVACVPTADEAEAEATDESQVTELPKEKTAKDFVPTAKEKKEVSYLIGIQFGSFIKNYNFGDVDYAQVKAGINDFINAKGSPRDPEFGAQFKVDANKMNEIFNNYLEKRHNYILYTNKDKEDKFLAKNAKQAGVQTTASGLQYKVISEGNEVKPGPKDTVWVNYKGTLIDGTVFDQTAEGADPIKFTLNRVVPGWSEGLQLIGEGGEIVLYVPAKLGYGERGTQGIEPNSTLIFNVSLDKVGKVVAE